MFHLNLPDDSTPQQGEDHEENERAPDDKMVDPRPVMSVQRQLLERRKTRRWDGRPSTTSDLNGSL